MSFDRFIEVFRNQEKGTKHIYSIELTNSQRLEISELFAMLKDLGVVPKNSNLGIFMRDAFYRGLYEYKKDIMINDG